MSGFDGEPSPAPEQVIEQMRDATERLREQAWMVAPLTSAVESFDAERSSVSP